MEPHARLEGLQIHEAQPSQARQAEVGAPLEAHLQWSMDFMQDTLYHGKRFRTLNVLDAGIREVLDENLFGSLFEVRETVHEWMTAYNEERPHNVLGNLPPPLYRQQLTNQNRPDPLTLKCPVAEEAHTHG
jgi:transposase InsO family protein